MKLLNIEKCVAGRVVVFDELDLVITIDVDHFRDLHVIPHRLDIPTGRPSGGRMKFKFCEVQWQKQHYSYLVDVLSSTLLSYFTVLLYCPRVKIPVLNLRLRGKVR